MSDIYGRKSKPIIINAPIGQKIQGRIIEVRLSEKFDDYIDIKIEFPQYKKVSDDGSREFVKQAFYGISIDWSTKNKAGRLYYSLEGKLPGEDNVNWTKLLFNRDVMCIFEDNYDEKGDAKGQKIKWIGRVGGLTDTTGIPEIQVDESELKPDDEVPF